MRVWFGYGFRLGVFSGLVVCDLVVGFFFGTFFHLLPVCVAVFGSRFLDLFGVLAPGASYVSTAAVVRRVVDLVLPS